MFHLIKVFPDLPMGTREKQKEFLRTGGEINLQTAIALYRNNQNPLISMFRDVLPTISILCGYNFLRDMWKAVKLEKSDIYFLFDQRHILAISNLIEAKIFIEFATDLLYRARDLNYDERRKLLTHLNHITIKICEGRFWIEVFSEFDSRVSDFKETLSLHFCGSKMRESKDAFQDADWQSLSGRLEMLKTAYLMYSDMPFGINNYRAKIDEVASDFIENQRWLEFKSEGANVFNFCHFLAGIDQEKFGGLADQIKSHQWREITC